MADPQKAKARAATDSFKAVAENFLKRHVEANKLRNQPEIKRILSKYAHPASSSEGRSWAERPFCDIKQGEVNDLLDRIQDQNGARQADMVLALIRKIANWYA